MKYDAGKIMMSDKAGINDSCGENNLVREGMDFDTVAKTDTLIEAAPKVQSKPTVQSEIDTLAKDDRLYG